MAELNGLVVIEPDTLEQPSLKTQYKILYTDEGFTSASGTNRIQKPSLPAWDHVTTL